MPASIVVETITHVRAIVAGEERPDNTKLDRVAEWMRRLITHSDEIIAADRAEDNGRTSPGLKPIFLDDSGLILTRGIVLPEQPTPVHSHGSWGVVGVYRGRDRYQVWHRHDDGDGAGSADVRLVEEHILGPGDVMVIPPPPQDIHVQQGYEGETAHEFVLFGKNVLGRLPYLMFDPERGHAVEAHPQAPRSFAKPGAGPDRDGIR